MHAVKVPFPEPSRTDGRICAVNITDERSEVGSAMCWSAIRS